MSKQAFLDAAKIRRSDVTIHGLRIFIEEPAVLTRIAYAQENRKNKEMAMANLIFECCHTEAGEKLFTKEEAMDIALGSGRTGIPLINAILSSEDDEKVKNDSAPNENSSSSSPDTSEGPSES